MFCMGRVGALLLALLAMSAAWGPCAHAVPGGEPARTYGRSPVWSSCQRFIGDSGAVPAAQCGTVAVPVDYAKPEGAQAQLAVIRVPATGRRIGLLVVNPGGPGTSAVDTVAALGAALAGTDIAQRFDLVGVDPRGVGHSTPELRCRTDAQFDAYRRESTVDYSPRGVARIEAHQAQLATLCVQKMGVEFLANVGTAAAVADLDVVREALGESRISYLGFSYGTKLGAAYATRYPDRVRAMVLDGAVDPTLDPITSRIRQTAGFQTAFDDYAANCARSPGCPLGTDRTRFVTRFHQLVDPLATRPARTSDPRGLSYSDAMTGTVNALYSKRSWPDLTSGLLGLQRGTDPVALLRLADDYQRRDASGHYASQQDAFRAIHCVDSQYPREAAVWAEADRRLRTAAPFLAFGRFTGFAPRDLCSMWPAPATSSTRPARSPGAGKVVVVSVTHDPATPHQAGVDLARQLGASLITVDGSQHTVVFQGDPCVDTAVTRFLVGSAGPRAGARC